MQKSIIYQQESLHRMKKLPSYNSFMREHRTTVVTEKEMDDMRNHHNDLIAELQNRRKEVQRG